MMEIYAEAPHLDPDKTKGSLSRYKVKYSVESTEIDERDCRDMDIRPDRIPAYMAEYNREHPDPPQVEALNSGDIEKIVITTLSDCSNLPYVKVYVRGRKEPLLCGY
jgi:hypothetical protein